jgi:site-specific recombinase XerD
MNTSIFHSALAEPLSHFVQYKRALNRKYRTEAAALRLLDHFLCEHAVASREAIDSTLIENFLKSRPRARPRSYNHLVGVLHRFFAWAVMQRLTGRNPVTARPRRDTGQRIPYLFDLRDAKRLLQLARTLPDNPRAPQRALVYETVFALLYGLGLRVGEVGRLKLGDADLAHATLFIRETKFSKSRIVPMGPNLAERLRCYVEQRYGGVRDLELPLFAFAPPRAIGATTITQTFHKLIPKLELPIPAGVSSPRLHDLRRSFAVRTLLRWYREGVDPNSRLMHLATFLGHVDPTSTAVYLPITEELLREADQRFRALAPKGGAQ